MLAWGWLKGLCMADREVVLGCSSESTEVGAVLILSLHWAGMAVSQTHGDALLCCSGDCSLAQIAVHASSPMPPTELQSGTCGAQDGNVAMGCCA